MKSANFPLTLTQVDLYFDQLHHSDNPLYNIGGYIKLEKIEQEQLRKAHRKVIKDNDAFGIRIVSNENGVEQYIDDDRTFDLPFLDFSHEKEAELIAEKWVSEKFQVPFVFEDCEIFKAFLLKISATKFWYVGLAHHLCMDGWGFQNWASELGQNYNKYSKSISEIQDDKSLKLDWKTIVQKDQDYLGSQLYLKDKNYWINNIKPSKDRVLPINYSGDIVFNRKSGRHTLEIDSKKYQNIKLFSDTIRVGLSQFFLSCLSICCAKTYAQKKITFGIPVHNRKGASQKETIGVFTSVSPLTIELTKNLNFSELAKYCLTQQKSSYRHQRYPIGHINQDFDLKGDSNELYEINYNYLKLDSHLEIEGVTGELVYVSHSHEATPLVVNIWEYGEKESLEVQLDYNNRYFSEEEIKLFGSRFYYIVEQVLSNPLIAVESLKIIQDSESKKINTWSLGKKKSNNSLKLFYKKFHEYVKISPNNIAVEDGLQNITYCELEKQSSRLAVSLIEKGISSGKVVAVSIDRSIDLMISILAIMKAGGTFLTLDSNYPRERLEYMLHDSGTVLLLISERKELVGLSGTPTISINNLLNSKESNNYQDFSSAINLQDLAYIAYTSGSTGLPKGVKITHENLSAYCDGILQHYALSDKDRVLQFSSISFDIFVEEFSAAFISGGTLVLRSDDILDSIKSFVDFVLEKSVTVISLPTEFLHRLCSDKTALNRLSKSELRLVIAGGEALSRNSVLAWQTEESKNIQLLNTYGPTETTVIASIFDTQFYRNSNHRVPIGKPTNSCSIYVLSSDLEIVPIGVVGEIYIGGAQVSPGYLNQETKNSKFVKTKFLTKPLYQTGDLARWTADGELEYIGRNDNQIKLRGYRIELDEIEQVIQSSEIIREVAVLVTGEPKQIVAFIVTDNNEVCDKLRSYLEQRLPQYMIPAFIVPLNRLPITSSGKIDRKKLANQDISKNQTDYIAASTENERIFVEVWESILGIERIGVNDDFFRLGGDSILSMQVVTNAAQRGLLITAKQLFEYKTIKILAKHAKQIVLKEASQKKSSGEQRLLPIQNHFLRTDQIEQHHFNQSVVLKAPQELSLDWLNKIFSALIERHDVLRLYFRKLNNNWSASYQVSEKIDVAVLTSELTVNTTAPILQSKQVSLECDRLQKSFDLEKAGLLKAAILSTKLNDKYLFLVAHHLIIDGVSWRILIEDINQAYAQLKLGEKVELGLKTTSLQSFSQDLVDSCNASWLKVDEKYWISQYNLPVAPLPVDNKEIQNNCISTSKISEICFDNQQTKILLTNTSHAYGTHVEELLLTAVWIGLNEWCGHDAFRIDLESHGRDCARFDVDLSQTVGWFTCLYPVVLRSNSNHSLAEKIKMIKEHLRLVPDKGMGFSILSETVKSEELIAASQGNKSDICFNYLGQFNKLESSSEPFKLVNMHLDNNVSLKRHREYLLDFNAMVTEDGLKIRLDYNGLVYQKETIAFISESIYSALEKIIRHCKEQLTQSFTPSDFPLANLRQSELDTLNLSNVETIYAATPMQKGMLYHTSLESSAYITQITFDLHSQIDLNIFKQSWQIILQRHEVFRSAFIGQGFEQVIQKSVELPWFEFDWSKEKQNWQSRFNNYRKQIKEKGFDLTKAPLLNLSLFKKPDETYSFLWSSHHAIIDGWSVAIIMSEIFQVYIKLKNKQLIKLPQTNSYQNYIQWLNQKNITISIDYWIKTLKPLEEKTQLGIEVQSQRKGDEQKEEVLVLTKGERNALVSLAKNSGTTLNTIVQAAWAYLLHRYSGNTCIAFGETVAGRPQEISNIENMVGLFLNTLPVVVEINKSQSVVTWLKELHYASITRAEAGFLPLLEIQQASSLAKGQSLFDSLVVFENYPVDELLKSQSKQILANERILSEEESNYSITLQIIPSEKLKFNLKYNVNRYSESSIQCLMLHLKNILASLPECEKISDISFLTEQEKNIQLKEWQCLATPYEKGKCIHELFEQQVNKTPNSIAVRFNESELTYKELNQKANQLAHYLLKLGVKTDSVVGLLVESSLDTMVGILGVLKSGAAYAPLDPAYPEKRLNFMLDDLSVSILLTQKQLNITNTVKVKHLFYLEDIDTLNTYSDKNIIKESIGLSPQNLAFVVYTSGSTGLPKGVLLAHEGLVNMTKQLVDEFEIDKHSRVLQFASLSFDVATSEWATTLCSGAELHLLPATIVRTPGLLDKYVRTEKLTHATLSPMVLPLLKQELWTSVKTMVVCGDPVVQAHAEQWSDGRKFLNAYGPSEATVLVTSGQFYSGQAVCHMGKPLGNCEIYILDKDMNLLPAGVPGELHIGGVCLAKGYLNRPELTKEKFVENPYSKNSIDRLYKTGDLVRWLEDGNIEYLGRIDHQIKIFGVRVEPAEIANTLLAHELVKEAYVMSFGEGIDKKLIAYVIPSNKIDDEESFIQQAKSWLEEHFPNIVIPSVFTILDSLPSTPNGKVDRVALPKPENSSSRGVFVEAKTEIEIGLRKIWAELLSIDEFKIGTKDSFLELGGNSLTLVRLEFLIKEQFEVEVKLKELFENSNIISQAKLIKSKNKSEATALIPAMSNFGDKLPLSFSQKRLWFIEQLSGSQHYNVPCVLKLEGELNEEALKYSLHSLIERHPILRTSFIESDGEAYQIIQECSQFDIEKIKIMANTSEKQLKEIEALVAKKQTIRFDLSRDVLLRVTLFEISSTEWALLLVTHHIAFDGVSMGIFTLELSRFYQSFLLGRESDIPPLAIQYADFAQWQSSQLENGNLKTQIDFWLTYLNSLPPVHSLPLDRKRPEKQSYKGDELYYKLTIDLSGRIKKFCQNQKVSIFMFMQTVFAILISRYSNQNDIVMGTPVSGRTHKQLENLIGFFVNTLVIRSDLEGDPKFSTLLERNKNKLLQIFDNQDVPFEMLVEQLKPERSLSCNALYQIVFAVQNFDQGEIDLPGLSVEHFKEGGVSVTPDYDLGLHITDIEGELVAVWSCNRDVFDLTTIHRFAVNYSNLLNSILNEPEKNISDLSLIDEGEIQTIKRWNQTQLAYPKDKGLQELFEKQVELNPEKIAAKYGEETITYKELNEQSNQLAHYLVEQGVKSDKLVALCLPRSIDMMIGILAIIKAGGAYVPIDIELPEERIELMLSDSGVEIVLTHSEIMAEMPFDDLKVLPLDSNLRQRLFSRYPVNNLAVEDFVFNPTQLAYVIYTSGSTGVPKGVMVSHENVVGLVFDTNYIQINSNDNIAQAANTSFDAATFEIWGAWCHGATLSYIEKELLLSPTKLSRVLRDDSISIMFVTTALLNQVAHECVDCFSSLNYLLFGGEQVNYDAVQLILDKGKPNNLIHVYGPTETTTFATYQPLTGDYSNNQKVIAIGGPMANVTLSVVDNHDEPLPIGAVGELYIGGRGVARGYLNQPNLSAERFIHNFSNDNQYVYRTGDLVRWLADGSLEFIGRTDHQVKVRGFRIELGEIEHQLTTSNLVTEAIVVAIDDANQDQVSKRLVAYIVAEKENTKQIDCDAEFNKSDFESNKNNLITACRNYLQSKLPAHMVPSAFVVLDSLPLNINGKVDRKALPEITDFDLQQTTYSAPKNNIQKILCEVWQQTLKLEKVGITDNFFYLGGDSILSIRVVSEAKQRGLLVSVKDMFKYQTITDLAPYVSELSKENQLVKDLLAFELLTVEEIESLPENYQTLYEDVFPMSELQQGMIYHSQLKESGGDYHNILSFHAKFEWNQTCFEEALEYMFACHPVLKSSYLLNTKRPLVKLNRHFKLPLECGDIRDLNSEEQQNFVEKWLEEQRNIPFSWDGPLFKVFVYRRSNISFEFGLNFHHAVLDGWSDSMFISQLFLHYQARLNNQSLPDVTPEYIFRDFVAAEINALKNVEAKRFWEKSLAHAPQFQLPRNNKAVEIQRERTPRTYQVEGFEKLSEPLYEIAKKLGVPLQSVLLAAHNKVLSFISGQKFAVSSIVSNGRPESIHGDQGIGLFLNALPICVEVEKSSWKSLIKSIAAQMTDCMEFRSYPSSAIQRDTQRTFSEVSFNYTHFHAYQQLIENSAIELLDSQGFEQTNFDLAVDFSRAAIGEDILSFYLTYDKELYDLSLIKNLANYYISAFQAILTDVSQSHTAISLLSKSEQQQLLQKFEPIKKLQTQELCVTDVFNEVVNVYADKSAIEFNDEQISYKQLEIESNQLAHYLIQQGIKSGDTVGICLERSFEMFISLFAVLKAGAAYVPLDPKYPVERLEFMVADARVSILLCSSILSESLNLNVANTLCLDNDILKKKISLQAQAKPEVKIKDNHVAYVIYTSGSTGQPKGVMVSHKNLVSYLDVIKYNYKLNDTDRVLQFSSFAFDISVEELAASLLNGGTLVLRDERIMAGGTEFWPFIIDHKITAISLPTAFWHQLAIDQYSLTLIQKSDLKTVIVGGEAMSRAAAIIWKQHVSQNIKLFNTYGPTEATITATIFDVSANVLKNEDLPIGEANQNALLYVLDEQQQLLPRGVAGELYIGGDRVALGYMNGSSLDAERFIANPFSEQHDAFMYRTGDRVRWLDENNLGFLGRVDDQVKVRGYRIELGEIESLIKSEPIIANALVIAKKSSTEELKIVAYVVPSIGAQASVLSLKLMEALKEKLPDYMLPAAIVVMDSLPVTATGKLDKKSLPEPDYTAFSESAYVAPTTDTEKQVCAMWKSLLGLEKISVHDKFFDIGGNSLLVIREIAQLRQEFNVELNIGELFDLQTVYLLSQYIDTETELNQGLGLTKKTEAENEAESRATADLATGEKWEI